MRNSEDAVPTRAPTDAGMTAAKQPELDGDHVIRTAADSIRTWRERGPASSRGRRLVWLRRVSQALFLLLFLFLLVRTEFRANFDHSADQGLERGVEIGQSVDIFLELDPLVAVSTAIANRSLYSKLLIALVVLLPTILMGRFFCGWICPLGTLNHCVSEIKPHLQGARRIERNRYRPYMRLKYYVLVALLVAALMGSLQIGLIDPICLLVRSLGLAVIPALDWMARGWLSLIEGTGIGFLGDLAHRGQELRTSWLTAKDPAIHGAWFLGLVFLLVMVANRWITRFWCRGLCPLGALLGLFSRFSIVGMQKANEKCTNCKLCQLHCQGADEPQGGVAWRPSECHLCMNCEGTCPEGVIQFTVFPRRGSVHEGTDLGRRALIASAVGGLAFTPLARVGARTGQDASPELIRPPGSLSEQEFLGRCIKCGACMKVCPNDALHPALAQAGLEGFWSPILIPRIGYCEASCTLCSQVCPTGAIELISPAQRLDPDPSRRIRIGTAFFDRGRCLPWAMDTPCIVCEEWCPVSPKAIWLEEVEVHPHGRPSEGLVHLRRPHLDPERCIGCGACENACPVVDCPAVRVSAIGETREAHRRLLLGGPGRDEDPN